MKKVVNAKISNHRQEMIVLWDNKDYKVGSTILAMEFDVYKDTHSKERRLKSNPNWKKYLITEVSPILYLSKI